MGCQREGNEGTPEEGKGSSRNQGKAGSECSAQIYLLPSFPSFHLYLRGRVADRFCVQREKRRKELLEKEKEKAELEKKELELTKLRQQLQEQETRSKTDSEDKKEDEFGTVPVVDAPKDEERSESATDEDSDEENVPPPSTPPETAWITVPEGSS